MHRFLSAALEGLDACYSINEDPQSARLIKHNTEEGEGARQHRNTVAWLLTPSSMPHTDEECFLEGGKWDASHKVHPKRGESTDAEQAQKPNAKAALDWHKLSAQPDGLAHPRSI